MTIEIEKLTPIERIRLAAELLEKEFDDVDINDTASDIYGALEDLYIAQFSVDVAAEEQAIAKHEAWEASERSIYQKSVI